MCVAVHPFSRMAAPPVAVLVLLLATTSLENFIASGQSLHAEEVLAARHPAVGVEHYCTSFRFNAEVRNLVNGWLVPLECVQHVRKYINRGQYAADVQAVIKEASLYAKNVSANHGKKAAWVLDIDETSLSNVLYYANHSYGATKYNATEFNAWVNQASAPPLLPTLALFKELVAAKWNVIFLTGRPESQREVTTKNLLSAGYKGWTKLILKNPQDPPSNAVTYKSNARKKLVQQGYQILGNVGDQWSDISGSAIGTRIFKLPNPLYYIP